MDEQEMLVELQRLSDEARMVSEGDEGFLTRAEIAEELGSLRTAERLLKTANKLGRLEVKYIYRPTIVPGRLNRVPAYRLKPEEPKE